MSKDSLPVAHATSKDIMTTLEFFTNKPQVWPDLRKSYGQDILDFDIIGTLKGSNKYIASESFSVEEELPPFRTLKIGANSVVSATPGGVATIRLDADDLDSLGNYYPRVKQEIVLGTAYHKAVVVITAITVNTGPTPHTVDLTVYPKAGSTATVPVTLDSSYIATGLIASYVPVVDAGNESAAVTGTMRGYQNFTYYLETIKSNKTIGDAELARENWVTPDGKRLWNKLVTDLDIEVDAGMEMKIHIGEENINTTNIYDTSLASNSSIAIYGTKGIWNWIGERGSDIQYTSASGFNIEDFYKMSEYGESVGMNSGEWIFNAGNELLRTVEKSCRSYIINATGSMNEMFTPDAGGGLKNLEVGFKHIQLNGGMTKIILKSNHLFTNPLLLGANASWRHAAEVFPLMQVRDRKAGGWVPNLQLVYRGIEGYNRARIIAPFAGMGGALKQMAGAPIVLESDISKLHVLCEFGVAFLEAWRGMRVYRTDAVT